MPQTTNNAARNSIRNRRGLVKRAVIDKTAQAIVERFSPERIILFGSYASGRARPDSDVDLLVVMPARNELDQSLRIEVSLDPRFALDVVVRTPKNLARRLQQGDWFLQEVVDTGKVLYEQSDKGVGAQGRGRPDRRKKDSTRKTAASR